MTSSSDILDDALDDIFDAIERHDQDGAIKLAEQAFQRDLDHPLILMLTAEGMEANGRLPEAIDLLKKVTGEAPGEAEGWRRLGNAFALHGDLAQAKTALDTALGIDPNVYWTLMAAASVSAGLKDLGTARGFFQRAAELEPQRPEPRAALAAIERQAVAEAAPPAKTWSHGFKVTKDGRPN